MVVNLPEAQINASYLVRDRMMADEDELEVELGRELTAQQQQQQDDSGEEGIPVRAERVGPPLPEDDAGQRLWPINELLGEIRGVE